VPPRSSRPERSSATPLQRVTALPFSLRGIKDEGVVQFIDDVEKTFLNNAALEELGEDLAMLEEEMHLDSLRLEMLQAILQFRRGEEGLARETLAGLRVEVRHNTAARAELDRIERTYTPSAMLARAMDAVKAATPETKAEASLQLSQLADRHFQALRTKFGPELMKTPAKLPAPERATYRQVCLALVLEAAAKGQLLRGLLWAGQLAEDKEASQAAQDLLRPLPLTLDLPDEAARQLWKEIPVLDKLSKDQLKAHLATINRLRGSSVYIRLCEFLWVYKQGNYDKAGAVLDELRPVFAGHLKTQGASAMMALMLRTARDTKADTLRRMEDASQERLKYFNDYNSTVDRLNNENAANQRRDERVRQQALGIQQAKDSGMLSTQEALSQVQTLQAISETQDGNEYTRRDRQRYLDFLTVAKQKIAQYDQELRELSNTYNANRAQQVVTLQESLAKLAE